jgi:hypothetical protein
MNEVLLNRQVRNGTSASRAAFPASFQACGAVLWTLLHDGCLLLQFDADWRKTIPNIYKFL